MLRDYLVERKEDIRSLKVYPRKLRVNLNFSTVIAGPRRAGKTYFLYYLIKKLNLEDSDFLFVNFEDYEISKVNPLEIIPTHIEIYKKEPRYIFLDEVQAFKGWQRFVYSLIERQKYAIFLTGSSSKLLSKEVATYLRGRFLSKILLPLSFKEFLVFKNEKKEKILTRRKISRIKSFLMDYLRKGGFPEVVLGKLNRKEFVDNYLDIVLYKDFVERFGLENPEAARFLIYSLIQSNCSEISLNKLYNQLKQTTAVSRKTVRKYFHLLPETLITFILRKYSLSKKKTYLSQPKVYLCDPSLDFEENGIGRKMENVVFLELLKQNKEIYYFQTKEGYEIDFLIKHGTKISSLIQVTYASDFTEIDARECRALIKVYELFKQDRPECIVITWDYEGEKELTWFNKKAKIRFIPLWKWLQ